MSLSALGARLGALYRALTAAPDTATVEAIRKEILLVAAALKHGSCFRSRN